MDQIYTYSHFGKSLMNISKLILLKMNDTEGLKFTEFVELSLSGCVAVLYQNVQTANPKTK